MLFLFKNPFTLPSSVFILVFLALVFGSASLYTARLIVDLSVEDQTILNNVVITQYQFDKIDPKRNIGKSPIETIIVGDSSAGNAIDAKVFSELIGHRTENLALSGSFGFAGSYNMIRHVANSHPLKNVIIVQTLDIWNRPFSRQGYLDTLRTLPVDAELRGLLGNTSFTSVQPKSNSMVKILFSKLFTSTKINIQTDYLSQKRERFSNKTKTLSPDAHVSPIINSSKLFMYQFIDQYCAKQKLRCIFVNGPILAYIAGRSQEQIDAIFERLRNTERIIFLGDILVLRSEEGGDSSDHVDPFFKEASTIWYAQKLIPHLRR